MNSKQFVKAALMLGGGYLLFLLVKPKKKEEVSEKKSLDGEKTYPAPNSENAEIVMMAYSDALKNGEPSIRLTELNKEMMNEFGMRCYVDSKTNQLVVCDVKGETILTK
jgi:hypothetical protein